MFDFFFGWRKASKCKKLLKRVQYRLKILKNKRHSIVRQLRDDVAQLIKIGYEEIAFNRVEQLFVDENMMSIYELLDNFSELILKNMSYIRRNKDCPNDLNEAVSSLIFASARLGELPELRVIRKLFGERYGQRFEMASLELLPGNLVNFQVKERMSIQSVPDDVKNSLVDDIARENCLRAEILPLEYIPEQQQQEIENNELRPSDAHFRADSRLSSQIEEFQIPVSTANDTEGKAIYIDLASTRQSSTVQSQSRPSYDVISTPVSPSTGQVSSPDIPVSPVHEKEAEVNNHVGMGSQHRSEDSVLISPRSKELLLITASSSESLPHFPDEMIVYLDDVEEIPSSCTKAGSFQDQRIFKFKSYVLPKTEKIEESSDVKYMDQSESLSEISLLSNRSTNMKPTSITSKRRSAPLATPALIDIDSEMYYNKPCKKPSAHKHRHSCHKETRRKKTILSQEFEYCSVKYPEKQSKKKKEKISEVVEAKQGYVRAMTMPQERCKESKIEKVVRCGSFPVQSPSHVHPNLPDYDDIAAKFRALKQQHLRNICNSEL